MNSNSKPIRTFYHRGLECNLQAVKATIKVHRRARICRNSGYKEDVIDIIEDNRIIERHIAKLPSPLALSPSRRRVSIDEMALYQ